MNPNQLPVPEIRKVLLTDIRPNNYNPNIMTTAKLAELKKTIGKHGFLQPIVIRPDPENEGKYVIVDGEHRWLVVKDDPRYQEPQAVIFVDADEDLAKAQTINMNLIRGELDRVKVSGILHDLLQRYSMEEVQDLIGMNQDEIQTYDDMAGFDMDKFEDVEDESIPEEAPVEDIVASTINIDLTEEEEKIYHKAVTFLPQKFQKNSGDDKLIFMEILKCFINLADPENALLEESDIAEEDVTT